MFLMRTWESKVSAKWYFWEKCEFFIFIKLSIRFSYDILYINFLRFVKKLCDKAGMSSCSNFRESYTGFCLVWQGLYISCENLSTNAGDISFLQSYVIIFFIISLFYIQGCLEYIEKWTQDQALILLAIVLAVMFVEVTALLSILLACSRGNRRSKSQASTFTSTQTLSPFTESDQDFSKRSFSILDSAILNRTIIFYTRYYISNFYYWLHIFFHHVTYMDNRYRYREQDAHGRDDVWYQIMKMAGGQSRTNSGRR